MRDTIKKIISNQGFQKYLKNTSWLFGERILRMSVGLVVSLWVARYLGPTRFGVLSYAQSFAALFTVFSTLGLDGIVVRELIANESKRDVLMGTSFLLKLGGAFFVILLLTVAVSFSSNDKITNVLIIIVGSASIFQSLNVIDFYFQSKVLSKFVVYANVITFFVSSVIKVILILKKAPLIAFGIVILVDSILVALGCLFFYLKNNLSVKKWRFDKYLAISLIKDSWPLILGGFMVSVYMKIDQVMIKEMLDPNAVGQYAAAANLNEYWNFINVIIISSLFPAILNAKKISEELYYKRLQRLYDLVVWIAIMIALPLTLFSGRIVHLLYGAAFSAAGDVLKIYVWSGVFVFLGVASGKWILSENLTMLSFWRTFIGAVVNIILNIVLIPLYGINGAANATLISYFISGFLFDAFHKKMRRTFIMKLQTINIFRLKLTNKGVGR